MGKTSSALVIVLLAAWQTSDAIEWEVTPEFAIVETYSDNLRLDADGLEVEDFVTEVNPAIAVMASDDRFNAAFNYRLQGLFYSKLDEFDTVLDYSSLKGTANLIGQSVLLDFAGAISQQIVMPEERSPISGISVTGNRSQVSSFTVSPIWRRALGKTSNVEIGYRYGVVEYKDPSLADNDRSGVYASISGAPPRTPWSWSVSFNNNQLEYDTGSEVELQRAGVEAGWTFSPKLTLYAGAGDESNTFSGISRASEIDGSFWNLGMRGELDRRTTYSISAGEQFFGDSYGLSLQRTAGDFTADISYLEETTTPGIQQLQYESFFQLLSEISGVELPTAGEEVYVRKRLATTARLKLARSSLTFNAYDEKRDYLTAIAEESDSIFGTLLSWMWELRPRTNLSFTAGWQKLESRNDAGQPEDTRLQLGIKQEIASDIELNLRLWRNSRSATNTDREYTVNAVSIGLRKVF